MNKLSRTPCDDVSQAKKHSLLHLNGRLICLIQNIDSLISWLSNQSRCDIYAKPDLLPSTWQWMLKQIGPLHSVVIQLCASRLCTEEQLFINYWKVSFSKRTIKTECGICNTLTALPKNHLIVKPLLHISWGLSFSASSPIDFPVQDYPFPSLINIAAVFLLDWTHQCF